MCGRYQFTAEQYEEIRQIVQAIQRRYGEGAWQTGEIRPMAVAPVLLDRGAELMRWGYQLPNTLVINARAETAGGKALVPGERSHAAVHHSLQRFLRMGSGKEKAPVPFPRRTGALYGGAI
jgi:hypothetical protein